ANNEPFYLYDDNNLVTIYRRSDVGGGGDFGYQFGTTGELRFGYEGGWEKFSPHIGPVTELPAFSGGYAEARVQYRLDRLDDAVIPRKGQAAYASFRWSNTNPIATNQFPALEGAFQDYFRLSKPTSLFLRAYGGTTFDYDTGLPQFSLGGSERLVS